MKVLVYDPCPTPNEIVQFVSLPELIRQSDVISLHCPLTPETRHLISTDEFQCMKPGTVLLNTSRGAVVDTKAAVVALKSGHLGGFGIDVYEEESGLFFHDLSDQIIQDEIFARLVTFPTVLVTGHQGFLTVEAIDAIVQTTFNNLDQLASDNLKPPFLVV
jgi:D-lactate dehydrogenase